MRLSLAAFALVMTTLPATATDFTPTIHAYLESEIRGWANHQSIVDAINAQNAQTSSYSQADIDRLDLQWRAEVGTPGSALIDGVLSHPVSSMLRERVAQSGGTVTEVFVMDALGLNVAAAEATSDYWQGDEEKFFETFPIGPDAVHISDVEFDESTQTFQVQVSIPIVDQSSNTIVGAITVGLDAGRL